MLNAKSSGSGIISPETSINIFFHHYTQPFYNYYTPIVVHNLLCVNGHTPALLKITIIEGNGAEFLLSPNFKRPFKNLISLLCSM